MLSFGRHRLDRIEAHSSTVFYGDLGNDSANVLQSLLDEIDILHVHNEFPLALATALVYRNERPRIVFHRHSPVGEQPYFYGLPAGISDMVDKQFVVGHFHPRQAGNELPMPNVIQRPKFSLPKHGQVSLLFSPSSKSQIGWSRKKDDLFDRQLRILEEVGECRVHEITGYSPSALSVLRTRYHFSTDEVVTGSFHQVSLEAMACGSIPVNGADDLSVHYFRMAYEIPDVLIPWMRTSSRSFAADLQAVTEGFSTAKIAKMCAEGLDFFNEYLREARIARNYINRYLELLRK